MSDAGAIAPNDADALLDALVAAPAAERGAWLARQAAARAEGRAPAAAHAAAHAAAPDPARAALADALIASAERRLVRELAHILDAAHALAEAADSAREPLAAARARAS
ncbi:MAG: hypothetical protein U0625_01880 [Phycisphaerales bacterium]